MSSSVYSDIDSNTANPQLLINEESVYQSIHNILSTRKTERLFLPEFGSKIDGVLFEIIDKKTARLLLHEITEAIHRWDNRVLIVWEGTSITPDPDNNAYDIILAFSIKGMGDTVYEFTGTLLTGATS